MILIEVETNTCNSLMFVDLSGYALSTVREVKLGVILDNFKLM